MRKKQAGDPANKAPIRSRSGKGAQIVRTLLLVMLISAAAISQPSDNPVTSLNFHRWGSLSLFNGLPSDTVRAIDQTPDGNLWFGTDQGLVRFDGRRINVIRMNDPASNRVLDICADSAGRLFVGTGNGAFTFRGERLVEVVGTEGKAVTALSCGGSVSAAADDGSILRFAAGEDGKYAAEGARRLPAEGRDPEPLAVNVLWENGDELLVGTDGGGIIRMEPGRTEGEHRRLGPDGVNALAGKGGEFYIGSNAKIGDSGLYRMGEDGEVQLLSGRTGSVLAIDIDKKGNLWAGSRTNGIFHFRNGELSEQFTFENTSGNLRSNTVFEIFVDREGVVWVGTDRGISRFDPASPLHQVLGEDADSNFVRTIHKLDDGTVYAGTNRGLFLREEGGWTPVEDLKDTAIYGITGGTPETLLAASPEGVFDLRGESLLGGDVRAVLHLGGRTYAAVFGEGLVRYSEDEREVVLAEGRATSAALIGGEIWIGTAGRGIVSFDGSASRDEVPSASVGNSAVWDIAPGDDGKIWVGTESGLYVLENGRALSIASGVDIRDVLVTRNGIWAASASKGLMHVRSDPDFGWMQTFINVEKGLPSDKVFAVDESDGVILTGTNRGIVTYGPDTEAPAINLVRALSRGLHRADELAGGVLLEYPQNTLLIEVAGQSSRTFPEEFQYGFLLRDSAGEVIDKRISSEPQYAPAALDPGDYEIIARAFDRDLEASDPFIARFSVSKEPFPWTATALGVLLVLSLGALIWAIVEHNRIRKRNRDLAAARRDLVTEAERERRRIARDLHDQTLADLRSLMMKSDRLSPAETWLRDDIEAVSTDIRRICEDLSPSVLENVGLVASLEFLLGQTIRDHRFEASEDAEESIEMPIDSQLQVYRIAQEVLTNIDRHSDADFVRLEIETYGGGFEMRIRDNGSPFAPEHSNGTGRGIANIRSRANIIKARISWESPPDGGNVFRLRSDPA